MRFCDGHPPADDPSVRSKRHEKHRPSQPSHRAVAARPPARTRSSRRRGSSWHWSAPSPYGASWLRALFGTTGTVFSARRTNKEKSPMAVFNGVFPIFPGKKKGGRDFAAACMGERRKGFDAKAARTGLTRETWSLQETPMGSFMWGWFGAAEAERASTDSAP